MEKLAPTLFLEIYRKRFGVTYDVAQESTWGWLTAQHISDFYAPAYTREHPPNTCLTLHKGPQTQNVSMDGRGVCIHPVPPAQG